MAVVLVLLGILLLVVLAADVFVTVFHPEGHGGPLTRWQSRWVWRVWRAVAPSGRHRDRWLALGGPVLAILTPAIWALLLVAGFALLYYPWIASFLASPGSLRAHWVEALYYSGFVAATLGSGDIVPDLPALRLLTIVEAVGGFALLSAALSYILAIYRENGRKATLAADLSLHAHAAPASSHVGLEPQRDRWMEQVARELLHVNQAHGQYPILHYFRPVQPTASLALQIAPLVRQSADPGPEDASNGSDIPPAGRLVGRALDHYLEAADERFTRGADGSPGADGMMERYLRLLRYLGYSESDAGLRTR